MKKLLLLLFIVSIKLATAQNKTESFEKAATISKEIATAFAKRDFDKIESYFSEKMIEKISGEKLKKKLEGFFKQEGDVQEILKFKEKITAEATFYNQGLAFKNNKYDLIFTLNEEKLLTSFRLGAHTSKEEWIAPNYVVLKKVETKAITIGEELPLLGEFANASQGNLNYVVVFVHGSGPNDMDESLGPNKLFKDLAYGLATKNIASIRYNKRSYDYPSKMMLRANELTIDDIVVNDAVEAVKKARSMGAKKVILLGHSLGGHMAPKIASEISVDGVILMAGNASPLGELILSQYEHINKYDSSSAITEFQMNMIKAQVKNLNDENYDEKTVGPVLPFSLPGSFWMSLQNYKPTKLAKKQKQPYLILNGERDYQVTVAEAKKWKNGNKNSKSKTIIYSGLNHMFYSGEGVLIPAEYNKQGNMAVEVLTDISAWVKSL